MDESKITWTDSTFNPCPQGLGGHPDKRERLDAMPEDLRVREFPVVPWEVPPK